VAGCGVVKTSSSSSSSQECLPRVIQHCGQRGNWQLYTQRHGEARLCLLDLALLVAVTAVLWTAFGSNDGLACAETGSGSDV